MTALTLPAADACRRGMGPPRGLDSGLAVDAGDAVASGWMGRTGRNWLGMG